MQNPIKKPKFNIKIVKKSFEMPIQPNNYKQINSIYDTGKMELVDYSGNNKECDIYGFPIKKYFNDISGISDYKLRLSKDLIKEVKFANKDLYIPITSKFEGCSMFPRPLSIPFTNQQINQSKLMNEIKKEKRISANKNKTILLLHKPFEDKKTIPSFICQKLSEDNSNDKKQIMNLIDNYVNKKKKEHKFELDYEHKNKEIKSLKYYKKILSENLGNNLYNGKNISESSQENIKEKYNAIRKLIYHQAYKNINDKEKKETKKSFLHKLNALKRMSSMQNIFKQKEILKKNKSCNNFYIKNKIQFQSENTNSFSKKNEIKNSMVRTYPIFSKINRNKGNDNSMKLSSQIIPSLEDKKINTPTMNRTKSSIFNNEQKCKLKYGFSLYTPNNKYFILENKNKTSINFFRNDDSSKSELIKKDNKDNNDNFSFISDDKNNENLKNNTKIVYNYKTINALKIISDKEKNLLKGFSTPIIENKILLKRTNFNKNNQALENYKKDIKLYEIVNKIHLEKEKKDNLFKEKLLMKKIEAKKIFENNFRKAKCK